MLKVISSSPGDLKPVFQEILDSATRICEANFGVLFDFNQQGAFPVAWRNVPNAFDEYLRKRERRNPQPGSDLDLLMKSKQVVHTEDMLVSHGSIPPTVLGGARTELCVPMLKDDELIGAVTIYRQEVRPFTDKQIELVKNFAAQAVIAIENTRLLNELRQRTNDLTESLEQQTATSEVLQVISSSPGELEPVFEAMLASARKLCEATYGILWLRETNAFRIAAQHGDLPAEQWRKGMLYQPSPDVPLARASQTRKPLHIADMREERSYVEGDPLPVAAVDVAGMRTLLTVPMLKENEAIGNIAIYRTEVRPFSDKQIALVTNFAAQAVIAIENTRLLNELRESLARQIATADVLKVISRSTFDLQTVLDTLVRSAAFLCRADRAAIRLAKDGSYHHLASHGFTTDQKDYMKHHPWRADRGSVGGRAVLEGKAVQVPDVKADPEIRLMTGPGFQNVRTTLGVPLIRDGVPIGALVLTRSVVEPFTDKQIELVSTFADQAVIAIENVRLFEAEQQRTRELSGALEQQTATSEVLKVISSSPGELEPVFQTLLENATRICEAKFGSMHLHEGGAFRFVAHHNAPPAWLDMRQGAPVIRPSPGTGLGHVAATKQVCHIVDIRREQGYIEGDPVAVASADLAGYRTVVTVPMLKDDELVGTISVYRQEVRPFAEKQIELLANFAAQAVIAIENTRLLNELRQRTDDLGEALQQQTATSRGAEGHLHFAGRAGAGVPGRCWKTRRASVARSSASCSALRIALVLCRWLP